MSENPGMASTANNISVTPTTTNDDPTMASTTNDNVISLRDRVEEALRTVYDPEIPVNIFDLGLVYETLIDGGKVKITMTLTAPACPVAGEIIQDVQQKVEAIGGVVDCHVNLTFDPPWTKEMMTEEAKLELGFL
jgi:FeS assembly SUF system protein